MTSKRRRREKEIREWHTIGIGGSTLDSFLEEKGVLAEFHARAIEDAIPSATRRGDVRAQISRSRLATMMYNSRTQIPRLLDPNDGNVAIETLQRRG